MLTSAARARRETRLANIRFSCNFGHYQVPRGRGDELDKMISSSGDMDIGERKLLSSKDNYC